MADRGVAAVWVDAAGATRLQVIKAATNPCSILTQAQAVSNAGILYNFDGPLDPAIGAATAALYQPVAATASLTFATAGAQELLLLLPAPASGIFLADLQTIDPTQIAALIAACVGELSDGAGNTATAFLGGHLLPTRSNIPPLG